MISKGVIFGALILDKALIATFLIVGSGSVKYVVRRSRTVSWPTWPKACIAKYLTFTSGSFKAKIKGLIAKSVPIFPIAWTAFWRKSADSSVKRLLIGLIACGSARISRAWVANHWTSMSLSAKALNKAKIAVLLLIWPRAQAESLRLATFESANKLISKSIVSWLGIWAKAKIICSLIWFKV